MTAPTQPGDRIRLIAMGEDPDPIEPGTEGTVNWVVNTDRLLPGSWSIGVDWDNGRGLHLVSPDDRFEVLS